MGNEWAKNNCSLLLCFDHRLQSVIDNFPERDVTILMGDFNAKIGSANFGYEEVMG